MIRLIKKKIVLIAWMVAALTATQIAQPTLSHAVVGAVTLNPILMIVGGAIGFGSLFLGSTTGAAALAYERENTAVGFFSAGVILGVAGIILLDQEQGVVSYQPLSDEVAKRLGLTKDQFEAYNAELDHIELINQTVAEKLTQEQNPSIEKAVELWSQYKNQISQEAGEGLGKVNKALVTLLSAAH